MGAADSGACTGCETDAHRVENARLTRRVDLTRTEFGHKESSFDAGAAAYFQQFTGIQKFINSIEHVKIDDA